jgi:hypothetical protein
MLFISQVPALFEKMELTLHTTANQQRKTEAAKRLEFYHDYQLERLTEQLTQLFSDPDKFTKLSLNIIKKVINNLAQVYREPPVRTLEGGSEKDQQLYSEILEQSAFDIKMKQASRYTKLLKTILLRPVWRNDRLDIDILTGNITDVITGDTPEQLLKVLITNYSTSGKMEDTTYSLWTPDTWLRLDYRGNVIEEQVNPYSLLPFLPVFDYPPPGSAFWLPGLDDLISISESVNLKLTDLMYLIRHQSFGVGWIRSDASPGGSVMADPGTLIELTGTESAIGFESQKAEIEHVVNAIDKLIKWACVSNGLSAGSMATDPIKQSGISKAWDSKELSEMRTDDIANFRRVEKDLFSLMRIIHNTHSTKKLSESATLKIDFAEVETKLSAKEQAEADDLKISQGVLSPVDVLMRENPDIQSREDALSHLLTIKDELRELGISE